MWWVGLILVALVVPLIMVAGCIVVLLLHGEEDTYEQIRLNDEEEP